MDGSVWRSSRNVKKNVQVDSIILKEENRAHIKKISEILKKSDDSRTEDDCLLLSQSEDVVERVKKRARLNELTRLRNLEIEDSEEDLKQKCQQLTAAIRNARHLIIYTGAGISTAASIPDYRGPNGVWTMLRQGKLVRTRDLSDAEPTFTHMAIAELCRNGYVKRVVSQNCDGLHMRSGLPSSLLSELHGNMYIEICKHCRPHHCYVRLCDTTERTSVHRHRTGRKCRRCRADLYDTIVHFGEKSGFHPPHNWKQAFNAADSSDMILCLGSSLKILKSYSHLWGMHKPANKRPQLYIVNLQWTPKDDVAALKINGKCDDVMKLVMKSLGVEVPAYTLELDPIFSLAVPFRKFELKTVTKKILSKPASYDQRRVNELLRQTTRAAKRQRPKSPVRRTPSLLDENEIKVDVDDDDDDKKEAKLPRVEIEHSANGGKDGDQKSSSSLFASSSSSSGGETGSSTASVAASPGSSLKVAADGKLIPESHPGCQSAVTSLAGQFLPPGLNPSLIETQSRDSHVPMISRSANVAQPSVPYLPLLLGPSAHTSAPGPLLFPPLNSPLNSDLWWNRIDSRTWLQGLQNYLLMHSLTGLGVQLIRPNLTAASQLAGVATQLPVSNVAPAKGLLPPVGHDIPGTGVLPLLSSSSLPPVSLPKNTTFMNNNNNSVANIGAGLQSNTQRFCVPNAAAAAAAAANALGLTAMPPTASNIVASKSLAVSDLVNFMHSYCIPPARSAAVAVDNSTTTTRLTSLPVPPVQVVSAAMPAVTSNSTPVYPFRPLLLAVPTSSQSSANIPVIPLRPAMWTAVRHQLSSVPSMTAAVMPAPDVAISNCVAASGGCSMPVRLTNSSGNVNLATITPPVCVQRTPPVQCPVNGQNPDSLCSPMTAGDTLAAETKTDTNVAAAAAGKRVVVLGAGDQNESDNDSAIFCSATDSSRLSTSSNNSNFTTSSSSCSVENYVDESTTSLSPSSFESCNASQQLQSAVSVDSETSSSFANTVVVTCSAAASVECESSPNDDDDMTTPGWFGKGIGVKRSRRRRLLTRRSR